MNEESGKIEYHYGFYAATHAEYHAFREALDFLQEQELGIKPVKLDMLIIRQDEPNPLKDPIGKFFRKYNILEYKSPEDGLTIDDFYKVQAYACLYKSMGKTVDEIPGGALTVSIFRHKLPRKMFEALERTGLEVAEDHPGVFHIRGPLTVPAQVIVTSGLPAGEYTAFKLLAKDGDAGGHHTVYDRPRRLQSGGREDHSAGEHGRKQGYLSKVKGGRSNGGCF